MGTHLEKQSAKAVFNEYADDYEQVLSKNLKFAGNDVSKFIRYKVEYLRSKSLSPKHILDFGCGNGRAEMYLQEAFPQAQLWGCDISENSIEIAAKTYPKINFFQVKEASDIDAYQDTFDLIFVSCVLHHIVPQERALWLQSLARSLAPKGQIAVFEHNPYNPATRYFVATCEFDEDAVLLSLSTCKNLLIEAGLSLVSNQYTLFFPWRSRMVFRIEKFLTWLPLGGQYCVICAKP